MSLHVLKRKLVNHWRRKKVRAAALIIVVLATIGIQYVLANRPQPVDIAGSKVAIPEIFSSQKLHVEALSDGLVINHSGKLSEEVDVHFSKARLAPNTVLDYEGLNPPTNAIDIHCTPTNWQDQDPSEPKKPTGSLGSIKPKPCNTSIVITPTANKPGVIELDFFQTDTKRQSDYRHLVLEFGNAEANVKLKFLPPLPLPSSSPLGTKPKSGAAEAVDCGKYLTVGTWRQQIGGPTEIGIIMEPRSSLRTRFSSLENNLWSGVDGYYEPFNLRSQQTGNATTAPLNVRLVLIRAVDGKQIFAARSAADSAIRIDNLRVGSDRSQISLSGTAYVTVNDKQVTESILKQLESYPLIAAGLGALNVAILAWSLRVLKGLFS